MSVKGMYQSFLLDCPFYEIILENFNLDKRVNINNILYYGEEFNLFDIHQYIRKISIKKVLLLLKNTYDLECFIKNSKNYDFIVLIDDISLQENCFFKEYSIAQIKALVWHLTENNVKVFIT